VGSSLAVGIPPRRQPVRASSCCLPSVLRLLWRTAAVAEGTHRALRLARPSTATDALGRYPLHLVPVPLFGSATSEETPNKPCRCRRHTTGRSMTP
ncbi:unnamed protein product, partial [Ectocarpus sp. 12 AP-2014]